MINDTYQHISNNPNKLDKSIINNFINVCNKRSDIKLRIYSYSANDHSNGGNFDQMTILSKFTSVLLTIIPLKSIP